MPLERYPEHTIVEYDNDLNEHLERAAAINTYITAIGIIPDNKGKILTTDRLHVAGRPEIKASLPQATLYRENREPDETYEEYIQDIVGEKFKLSEEVEVEIIGDSILYGLDNQRIPNYRLYVPVLHHNFGEYDDFSLPHSLNPDTNKVVSRSAKEILKILEHKDRTDGLRGQRSRAVNRFGVHAYLNHSARQYI